MKGAVNFAILMFLLLLVVSSGADLCLGVLDVIHVGLERLELQEIAKQVELYYQAAGRLPRQDEFVGFCRTHLRGTGSDGRDRWGTLYWFETSLYVKRRLNQGVDRGEFVLASAGPDRVWLSQDDIVVEHSSGTDGPVFHRVQTP